MSRRMMKRVSITLEAWLSADSDTEGGVRVERLADVLAATLEGHLGREERALGASVATLEILSERDYRKRQQETRR